MPHPFRRSGTQSRLQRVSWLEKGKGVLVAEDGRKIAEALKLGLSQKDTRWYWPPLEKRAFSV